MTENSKAIYVMLQLKKYIKDFFVSFFKNLISLLFFFFLLHTHVCVCVCTHLGNKKIIRKIDNHRNKKT